MRVERSTADYEEGVKNYARVGSQSVETRIVVRGGREVQFGGYPK
jgi:hypothetical protein